MADERTFDEKAFEDLKEKVRQLTEEEVRRLAEQDAGLAAKIQFAETCDGVLVYDPVHGRYVCVPIKR